MIGWHAKVVELKAMADEMELWAAKVDGHVKLVLGRNADELRRFAHQIELELIPPAEHAVPDAPPDWVTGELELIPPTERAFPDAPPGWVTGESDFPADEAVLPPADQEWQPEESNNSVDSQP